MVRIGSALNSGLRALENSWPYASPDCKGTFDQLCTSTDNFCEEQRREFIESLDDSEEEVRANSASVRGILPSSEVTPDQQNLMQDVDLIEEIDSGEWTLARRTLIASPAIGLSGTLKTEVIHLVYDDTSGLMGFRFYDCGKLTEEEFLDANADEDGLAKFRGTVDRRFKALGIGVPASAP